MRLRSAALTLAVIAIPCIVAGVAYGPVASVAAGCIALFLVCGVSLYRLTHTDGDGKEADQCPDSIVITQGAKGSLPDPQKSDNDVAPKPDEQDVTVDPQLEASSPNTQEKEAEAQEDQIPGSEHEATSDNTPTASEVKPPHFDYEAFQRSLLLSDNPLETLKSTVRRVRQQQEQGLQVPTAESFLTRLLEEAQLIEEAEEDESAVSIARPVRSGMFYLRLQKSRMRYSAYLRLLCVEAALNALYFAHSYYKDLDEVSEEDLYKVWQRTTSSICAQVSDVDTADWSYLAMPWQPPFGPSGQGEWAVRQALADAIESAQVPYRLEARYRCNVDTGDVAIEFETTPWRVFPQSAVVPGLGIVSTTSHMRQRESSAYAARLGILLANHAFRASSKIKRVWISGIEETPTKHSCLYSVCVGRRAFSHLHMSAVADPLMALRSLGASFEELNGVLLPTAPLFYLEDEQFCPPRRHDLWNLSERGLPVSAVQALGTSRVSGLLIHEELPRTIAADKILRSLGQPEDAAATQTSVRSIMAAAQETSDLSVWTAAERVAGELVEGKLGLDDLDSLRDEFVDGDQLTKAVEQAQALLMKQEPHKALELLSSVLGPLEREERYLDTGTIVYRSFDSFVERVVYNRLNSDDKRSVVLVPDAYLIAHLVLSAVLMSLPPEEGGNPKRALEHARRALEIAPLNGPANLGMAACLEAMSDGEAAAEQLKSFLKVAYHPQGMALAYFRLASLKGAAGNYALSQACLQRAVRLFPPLLPFALGEYQSLLNADESDNKTIIELMDDQTIEQILKEGNVPVAPTQQTAYILFEGATASVDAEIFPVARDLMSALIMITGDDVLRDIYASLEQEPDA